MPNSVLATFGDSETLSGALAADFALSLVPTRSGRFQARLARLELDHLVLLRAVTTLPFIAFLKVPDHLLMFVLADEHASGSIWDGADIGEHDIVALGPGQAAYARAHASAGWSAICVPMRYFAHYAHAVVRQRWPLPGIAHLHASSGFDSRMVYELCSAAMRLTHHRMRTLPGRDAAYGLEQQITHALIDCLSAGPAQAVLKSSRKGLDLSEQFEGFMRSRLHGRRLTSGEIGKALGHSASFVSSFSRSRLGVDPEVYGCLLRLWAIRRLFLSRGSGTLNIAGVARQYGFRHTAQLAQSYHCLFGELPSETLDRCRPRHRMSRSAHLVR